MNPFENAFPAIFYDFVAWVDNLSFPMQSTSDLSWALLWILHIYGWKICLWIFLKVKISSMKHLCPILPDLQLLFWKICDFTQKNLSWFACCRSTQLYAWIPWLHWSVKIPVFSTTRSTSGGTSHQNHQCSATRSACSTSSTAKFALGKSLLKLFCPKA